MQLVIENLGSLSSKKQKNVIIETERRNAESLQAAAVRLLDNRHRYATRSATIADSAVANASCPNKVLNLVISSARIARASREVQSDAQQQKANRARAIKRRQQKLDNPVNIAETVLIGAPNAMLMPI